MVSMVGAPLVSFLTKFIGKSGAAVVTLILFLLFSAFLVGLFVPPLFQQAKNLAKIDYKEVLKNVEEPISDWENWLTGLGLLPNEDIELDSSTLVETIEEKPHIYKEMIDMDTLYIQEGDSLVARPGPITIYINIEEEKEPIVAPVENEANYFSRVRNKVLAFIDPGKIQSLFGSILGFFSNILIAVMSVAFIAFFFLKEQGLFSSIIRGMVPNEYEDRAVTAIDQSSGMLIRYFLGVLSQITILTLVVYIALSFLGIKNALLLGFFAALMNVIPYLGPIIGAAFATIITISSNLGLSFYDEMLPLLIKVFAVFGAMQLVDNFLIQPNIFGKSVKAHPLEIFIVVLVGAKVGGIIGMVLAIPMYTVIRVIAKVFLSEFKIVQSITKGL